MKKFYWQKYFTGFLFILSVNCVATQAQTKNQHFIPIRIENDFEISVELSNRAWQQTESVQIKHEIVPDPKAPAPVKTIVKVLYSTDNLYIAFIANDPNPEKIRAQITDRDAAFGNDYVGVFLDTFGNSRQAFGFFANPLGVQIDTYRSSGGENLSFDTVWYSEGAITDSGYIAVMKIPFESLNFPEKKVQDWSVQFFRNYPRNARHQLSWTNVEIGNPCLLCQSGTMANIRRIQGGGTLELLPYVLGYHTSSLGESGDLSSGLDSEPVQLRIGGGISYDLTSTTSLNAVINPDFSQIETDAAQIAINQSFALFYPEKRPFFIRGADLFETSADLYYSRTINNPLAAGKFAHKSGNYSIGLVTAYDENTPFIIPGQFESDFVASSINSYVNIIRGKYNFGPQTYIGGLITTRNQSEGANYVGGIDWQLKLSDNYYIGGQLAYSGTDEISDTTFFSDQRMFGRSEYNAALNGEQYNGSLISIEFEREAKYYQFSLEYESISPTFQSQTGFINEANYRQISAEQNISYYPATKWLSQGNIGVFGRWSYDFSGQFVERFIMIRAANRLAGQTRLSIGYMPVNDERFRGRYFTGMRRFMFFAGSKPIEELEFGVEMEMGKYIYRTSKPVMGEGYDIGAFLTLRPIAALQLNFTYGYATLSSLDGSEEFYSGNILRLTGSYNFSRELSFRFITQYNSFGEQLQIYPLLSYKLNPFTKFYIGMTDYMNQLPGAKGINGFRQTNRQFFVKFQYLIRR